jgi:serine/threonine protein phosphatase PrpC
LCSGSRIVFAPDKSKVEEALHAFVQMAHVRTAHFRAGSTFSAALILENHKKVSIAVLGDSPVIVLDQDGQLHISPEHNVRSNLKERKAAQKRGGIYRDGYIFTHDETRGLQMSRALGNAHLNEILLREPDVYTITNPQWILVASDGVFDPGHHNTSSLLEEMRKYAAHRCTADDIMQWAEHRGLHDNATALVWRCSPIQRQITWLSWVNHFFRRIFYTTHFIHQKEAI